MNKSFSFTPPTSQVWLPSVASLSLSLHLFFLLLPSLLLFFSFLHCFSLANPSTALTVRRKTVSSSSSAWPSKTSSSLQVVFTLRRFEKIVGLAIYQKSENVKHHMLKMLISCCSVNLGETAFKSADVRLSTARHAWAQQPKSVSNNFVSDDHSFCWPAITYGLWLVFLH